MQISWLRHLAAGFFAVKIQLTTPVLLRVVLQSMQIWPKSGQVQDCWPGHFPSIFNLNFKFKFKSHSI